MKSNNGHQLAVVGCGYWGPNLIRNFSALPNCTVRTVCDQDVGRLEYARSLYPWIQTVTDFDAVLEDSEIDALAIVTPVRTHFPLARRALEAGKHVFVEKPLAASSEECTGLIETARRGGLTLMVGHTFVYAPVVRKIKEIIDSGELGDVLYISSRRLNLGLFQKDINVAWDLAPHDISIILYLLQEDPLTVNCEGKAHISQEIEDVTSISMDFAGGGFALVQSSWIDPRKVRELTIVGSKKMVVYDDTEPLEKLRVYDKCVEVPPHYDTFAEFQYSYHYGDMLAPHVKQSEPLRVEAQHFIDCIDNGTEPDSSGYQGLRVVRILEAASESLSRGGAPVHLGELQLVATNGRSEYRGARA